MLETKEVVLLTLVSLSKCALCDVPIPADGPALCVECQADETEKLDDYRAEREQARRPF